MTALLLLINSLLVSVQNNYERIHHFIILTLHSHYLVSSSQIAISFQLEQNGGLRLLTISCTHVYGPRSSIRLLYITWYTNY